MPSFLSLGDDEYCEVSSFAFLEGSAFQCFCECPGVIPVFSVIFLLSHHVSIFKVFLHTTFTAICYEWVFNLGW